MKINAHGHILPEPHEIPQFMRDKKLFWIDEDLRFMRQGDWSRPITDPSFFFEEKLEWMDRNKINHAVMLNLSQVYCNGWSRSDAHETKPGRFCTDIISAIHEPDISGFWPGAAGWRRLRRRLYRPDQRLN